MDEYTYEGNPEFDRILSEEVDQMYDEDVSNWDAHNGDEAPPDFDDWLDLPDSSWMLDAAYDHAVYRFNSEVLGVKNSRPNY